ncbi:MAG TPA: MFS transporter [Pyrinomonadaceae bacterium]|nr:MFS transporter [Pyrinomonadaceae bacterium]
MGAQLEQEAARRGPAMLRALSHADFRWFWAGALLSNSGTWMQTVAQGWLVLQLTNSPFWLGFDGFMATLPGLLLTLLGGVFADLVDHKRLLIYGQVGSALSALTLAVLLATGVVNDASDVWVILLLSFVTGCCFAIVGPSFQAITIDLVGREDLANAIALNSAQFQFSRVVGPLLAGLAMERFGIAGCFFINAFSFVAIIGALLHVKIKSAPAAGRSIWQDLLEGFRYVRERQTIRLLLLLTALSSLFGSPYLALMPVFARDVYGWGGRGLSLLMGAAGAGALAGSLLIAYLSDFRRKALFVLGTALGASCCLVGLGLASRPAFGVAAVFGIGFSFVCSFSVTNTLLQTLVSDEMRGRVLSMWMFALIGAMPVGSFVAGAAAERLGAPLTVVVCGTVVAAFVLGVAARGRRLREM